MDSKTCKRFFKQSIRSISLKYIILSVFFIYMVVLLAASTRREHNGLIEILGGFSLKQSPISVYVLQWIVPRFILIYILFVDTYNFIKKGVYLVFVRVRSKILFYSVVNVICLLIIFLWYICAYSLVFIYCSLILNSNTGNINIIFNMLFLDIFASYLIFNIFYMLTLWSKKIFIGAYLSIFIYLMPIFTKDTKSIIFKVIPSNYSMYLRQIYLHNALLYLSIGLILFILAEFIIIKKIEINNEGV